MAMSLLGEWGWLGNLENTAGSTAPDGTLVGIALASEDGPIAGSKAIRFTDTTNPNAVTLGRTGLEPTQDGFFVDVWFKIPSTVPADVGTLGLLTKARASGSSRFRVGIRIDGDNLAHIDFAVRWKDDLQFGMDSSLTLTRDVWHCVQVLDANAGWAVWVDGTIRANASRSFDNTTSPTWEDFPWTVGKNVVVGDQHTTPNLQIGSVRIFQAHTDGDFGDRERWRTKVGPPTTEPYSYYDLREGSGSAAPLSGFAVPFSPNTGASWAEPHRIVAHMKDGYPGWVDFGASLTTLQEWALAFDVKPYGPPSGGDYDALGKTLAGALNLYFQHGSDGKPTAYYGSEVKASTAMVAGTRHRIVYVSRGDRIRIYLDGTQVADTAMTVPWTTNESFDWLWNSTFDGEAYALRFWRHGLTDSQVAAIPAPVYPDAEEPETASVFDGVLPGTWSLTNYNDGANTITGSNFYLISTADQHQCVGGRVYVPSAYGGYQIQIMAIYRAGEFAYNWGVDTPDRSVTVDVPAGGGWVEGLWLDDPILMDPHPAFVAIGHVYVDHPFDYAALAGITVGSSSVPSGSDSHLFLAETTYPTNGRGRFNQGGITGIAFEGAWYGDDIVVLADVPSEGGEGLINGTFGWDGSLSGKMTPKGNIAGTHEVVGTLSGKMNPVGAIQGLHEWSATVAGRMLPKGAIAGDHSWAGLLTGRRLPKGLVGGNYSWSGLLTGLAEEGGVPYPWLIPANQMSVLRMQTLMFIGLDPQEVTLIPRVETETESGAQNLVRQTARAAQVFKLIHQGGTPGGKVFTTDGTGRREEFILLGAHDADVELFDCWEVGDVFFEVVGFKPYNGYEQRAVVNAYGRELPYGG